MQCFERQAMYLKLYAIAVAEIPRLEFDRNLLDDVLAEFTIDKFGALMELEKSQHSRIITHIKSLTEGAGPRKEETTVSRDRSGSVGVSNYALQRVAPSSSIRRIQSTIFP